MSYAGFCTFCLIVYINIYLWSVNCVQCFSLSCKARFLSFKALHQIIIIHNISQCHRLNGNQDSNAFSPDYH